MKKCGYCGAEYPDGALTCSSDGHELVESMAPASTAEETPAPTPAPPRKAEVVAISAAWMLANAFVWGFAGPAGTLALALITAFWAANDCRKIQLRGSLVLGLAFKPIVVFAVCAFFLGGLGFVWYLFMRARVMNALEADRAIAAQASS